jgi:O-antigen ligase
MPFPLIVLLPFALVLFSLVFFSRGILIFCTTLCLEILAVPYAGIGVLAFQFRWVFFALFCVHVFGDIFLGRTVRRVRLFDCVAIIFIVFSFFSISYSPFPKLTLERATTVLVLYIAVFWIIWKYAYEQGAEKVVYLILQAITPVIIVGYLMIFIGPFRPFLRGRFTGIFGNPNGLGIVSAITLPLSLWQFLETKKKSALFLFLLILLGLLLSATRSSLNATVLSLGYFIYARSRRYRPLVFFSSVSFILLTTWVIETLIKNFFMAYIRSETIPILGGRLEIWPIALNLILDKPIFGYGFGVEDKLIALKGIVLYKHSGAYVHNSYLGLLLQLGLFGFFIFFVPLFILLFKELFSRQGSEAIPTLRYALRATLIAGLICCIFESWIYSVGNAVAFPFWTAIMLLVFYRYQDKQESLGEIGT